MRWRSSSLLSTICVLDLFGQNLRFHCGPSMEHELFENADVLRRSACPVCADDQRSHERAPRSHRQAFNRCRRLPHGSEDPPCAYLHGDVGHAERAGNGGPDGVGQAEVTGARPVARRRPVSVLDANSGNEPARGHRHEHRGNPITETPETRTSGQHLRGHAIQSRTSPPLDLV